MNRLIVILVVVVMCISSPIFAQEDKPAAGANDAGQKIDPKLEESILGLITRLGSDVFEEREKAGKDLLEVGEPARPYVQNYLDRSAEQKDPEVEYRLKDVLRRLGSRAPMEIKTEGWTCKADPEPSFRLTYTYTALQRDPSQKDFDMTLRLDFTGHSDEELFVSAESVALWQAKEDGNVEFLCEIKIEGFSDEENPDAPRVDKLALVAEKKKTARIDWKDYYSDGHPGTGIFPGGKSVVPFDSNVKVFAVVTLVDSKHNRVQIRTAEATLSCGEVDD